MRKDWLSSTIDSIYQSHASGDTQAHRVINKDRWINMNNVSITRHSEGIHIGVSFSSSWCINAQSCVDVPKLVEFKILSLHYTFVYCLLFYDNHFKLFVEVERVHWWPSVVVCSMVGLLSLWHIPHFLSQFYSLFFL